MVIPIGLICFSKMLLLLYTNNVSVSGGTDKLKVLCFCWSYNQKGIIDKTSYDKYNFRSNMDAKITDNFDLSLGLSGYVSTDSEPGAGAGPGTYAFYFPAGYAVSPLTCALNTASSCR